MAASRSWATLQSVTVGARWIDVGHIVGVRLGSVAVAEADRLRRAGRSRAAGWSVGAAPMFGRYFMAGWPWLRRRPTCSRPRGQRSLAYSGFPAPYEVRARHICVGWPMKLERCRKDERGPCARVTRRHRSNYTFTHHSATWRVVECHDVVVFRVAMEPATTRFARPRTRTIVAEGPDYHNAYGKNGNAYDARGQRRTSHRYCTTSEPADGGRRTWTDARKV